MTVLAIAGAISVSPDHAGERMATIRLEYVKSYRNRHGKLRHYFRRKGQRLLRLPGIPGTP